MKVDYQKVSDCRGKLIITAGADETRTDYNAILKEYITHAHIPGFRPGKAPQEVVKRRFAREIDEDVRRRLVSSFYHEAVKQEEMKVAAVVDVSDVIFSPETGISFVATVDLVPTFKLPKYQKISIKELPVVVEEAQIEEELSRLRQTLARYEVNNDEPVALNDAAKIDFTATSNSRPLLEVAAGSEIYASGIDHWAIAKEPGNIPGMTEALIGLKCGDSSSYTVKFPKDFALEALRGVKADYSLTVKEVRRSVLPTDEEIVTRLRVKSLQELRDRYQERLEEQGKIAEERRQQKEIIDFLLKKCDFELPQVVVAMELQHVLRRMLNDMAQYQDVEQFFEENRDEVLKNAQTIAAEQVRLNYIMAAIAEAEKIEVAQYELDNQINMLADHAVRSGEKGMTYDKMLQQLEENGALERIQHELTNSKVIKWLLQDAKA